MRNPVSPVLLWVARLGPLVSRGRKGLRAQRGRGEWAEHQVVVPPGQEAATGEAAAVASFLQTQRSSSWPGRPSRARGRGTGALVRAGLLLASKAPCLPAWDRGPRACAGRQGGRGQRGSEWGGGGGESAQRWEGQGKR